MAINYTNLLGLAQPVTGTESNVWGDAVNDQITALLDSAIAGAATISLTAGNVTLTDLDGAADQARMAILVLTGTPGTTRNVVAPSRSKTYIVINQSNASAIIKGAATSGVTVRAGQAATCVFNGTDFEIVASGDVDGPASATNNNLAAFDGTTGKLIKQAATVTVAQGGTGVTTSTGTGNVVLSNSPTLVTPALGTPASGTVTNLTGTASININGTVGATTPSTVASTNLSYTGTLTGGTGVVNLGSGQVFKDASGNVGIGTSSPGARLSVKQSGNTGVASLGVSSINSANDTFIGIGFDSVSDTNRILSSFTSTGAFKPISFSTADAERMRIDSSGNVGIGTSLPNFSGYGTSNLSVAGVGTIQGVLEIIGNRADGTAFAAGDINFFANSNSSGNKQIAQIQVQTNGATANNRGGALVFATKENNGAISERARIDSSGNLLVGTTSSLARLSVTSSSTNDSTGSFYVQNDNAAADACIAAFATATNSFATSNVFIKFGVNSYASACGQINANGAAQAAFGSFSDRRLKENIVDLPPQLQNIMALRPVEFDYIQSEGGGHQINFIAQEFETVYPDSVGERSDGMKTLTGWGKTEARLVKAIQEQQAMIAELKAEFDAYKLSHP